MIFSSSSDNKSQF